MILVSMFVPIFIGNKTYYIIDNEMLIVRNSLFIPVVKIDIKTITKINETKKQIEICYKKYDRIKLSLKDNCGFINDLKGVNAGIEVLAAI